MAHPFRVLSVLSLVESPPSGMAGKRSESFSWKISLAVCDSQEHRFAQPWSTEEASSSHFILTAAPAVFHPRSVVSTQWWPTLILQATEPCRGNGWFWSFLPSDVLPTQGAGCASQESTIHPLHQGDQFPWLPSSQFCHCPYVKLRKQPLWSKT